MITKIVEQLKTGTIKNVVAYGSNLPTAPYVVVKQENEPLGRGTQFRIIAHFLKGQQIYLEDYIKKEVSELLTDFQATTRNNNLNELWQDEFGQMPELTVSNDDDTISMERVYWMPDKLN